MILTALVHVPVRKVVIVHVVVRVLILILTLKVHVHKVILYCTIPWYR